MNFLVLNPTFNNSATAMRFRDSASPRLLVVLSVAVAVFHLVVGLLYVNRFGPPATLGVLSRSGAAYLESFPGWNTAQEVDSAGFNRAATSILETGLPRSREGTAIWRTAVYSYFVAGCYAAGGVRLLPVAVAQAVLSGLTAAFLMAATGRLFPDRKFAPGIVGGLYLVNLRIAMYAGYVVPLIPTLFLTAVALWAVTRGSTVWIVAPLILGCYTSSTFFVVALAGAGWLILRRASILGPVLIVALVAFKFVLTWTDAAGAATEPNRAADRGGIFWLSNNPYYERMRPWSLWEWRGSNPWSEWKMSAGEQARHQSYLARCGSNELRAALLWIWERPGNYAQVCLARLRTEFGPYTGEMSPRNRLISTLVWLLVFPAGWWALWQLRGGATGQFVLIVTGAVFLFATLVTEEPYLRYRLPVDLLLTAFAARGYALLIEQRRGRA
jgi:hypothetical protein